MIFTRGSLKRNTNKQPCKTSGFTIIELLVVIVVIAVLAVIAIVAYTGIQQRAVVASLTSDLTNASQQLKLFSVDNGIFPATVDCLQPDSVTNKCIKASPDTTYYYIVNNNIDPAGFCLAATKGTTKYKLTNNDSASAGDCDDYGIVAKLDAGNPASYSGSGTTWTDLSGLGNHGTLFNGVGYSSANSGYLNFDGVDDYVNVPNAVNLIQNTKYFSIGIFFKINSLASLRGLIGTLNYNCSKNLGLTASNNDLSMYNDTTTCSNTSLSGWIETNKWLFAVATYDGVSTKVYGIKDGVLTSATGSAKTGVTNTFASEFRIMGSQAVPYFTNGSCAYAFVFNRTLPESEISQRYNFLRVRFGL